MAGSNGSQGIAGAVSSPVPPPPSPKPPSPKPPTAPPAVMHASSDAGEATTVPGSLLRVSQRVLGYVFFAIRFYFERRAAIRAGWRVWVNEHLPSFDSPDAIRREIRISLEEQDGVREESGVWHLDLPVRCIVCGGKAPGDWIVEPRSVLDPYGPIVGPLAGLIAGLYLSWFYGGLIWIPVSVFAGMLIGYAGRKDVPFVLRFKRCAKHAEPGRVPEVIVLHRHLVVRVGSRDVKLAFLQHARDIGPLDEFALPTEMIVAPPHEMIALADDVHRGAAIIPDQTTRLPTAEDENAPTERPPAGPDEYRLSQ